MYQICHYEWKRVKNVKFYFIYEYSYEGQTDEYSIKKNTIISIMVDVGINKKKDHSVKY